MKRTLVLALAVMTGLSMCLIGCGQSTGTCKEGQQPGLTLAARPDTIEANGFSEVVVQVTGLDENCDSLPAGTQVDLRLTQQEPEGAGEFPNGENSLTITMTGLGANSKVSSQVVGSAVVTASAEVAGEYLSAPPVQLTFEPPTVCGQCSVSVLAEFPAILGDGIDSTGITADLVSDCGAAMPDGTEVIFTTDLGEFTGSGAQDYTTYTTGSTATALLKSENTNGVDQEAIVTVTFHCDDLQARITTGTETVRMVDQLNEPFVDIRATPQELLADGTSTAALEADVFMPDGTRAPAGELVSFSTNLGAFQENGQALYETVTDVDGLAVATFLGGEVGGDAEVTAAVYIDGINANDTVTINVRQLGSILFIEAVPDRLGVAGSGVNESALLKFQVLDNRGDPFPSGALVTFEHSIAEGVTLDPSQDRTDNEGFVYTNLSSGNTATTVTVTATAQVGTQSFSAVSGLIAIVGAKPNARGLTFSCELVNEGGFNLDFVNTTCTVSLSDRFTNPIGIATSVHFEAEAGTITSDAQTSESGGNIGLATALIRTGNPRPKEVPAFVGEPSVIGGPLDSNPRDGMVTLIAVTTGEEEFNDQNANGDYDLGEPFVDLGEPYVDANDDGFRQADEDFLDANGNLSYDGPNGVWDSDTLIWIQTWMVWTGSPSHTPVGDCGAQYTWTRLCPSAPFNIAKGSNQQFDWMVVDEHLNPPNESLSVDIEVDGKGNVGASAPELAFAAPDSLGSPASMAKVDALNGACDFAVDPVCYIKPIFGAWSGTGFNGWALINGAAITDTQPPAAGTVSLQWRHQECTNTGANIASGVTVGGIFQ